MRPATSVSVTSSSTAFGPRLSVNAFSSSNGSGDDDTGASSTTATSAASVDSVTSSPFGARIERVAQSVAEQRQADQPDRARHSREARDPRRHRDAYEPRTAASRPISDVEAELRLDARDDSAIVWPQLPGSRVEGRAVAALFPESQSLLGRNASEAALSRLATGGALRHVDVFHFATHALISHRRPWASALVLAVPDSSIEGDGYLTTAEIGRLALNSTLVVLSACETATGNALDGEGVLGFPYVLLASGNRSTMLTQWPIEDRDSARLMHDVLREVRRGTPPSTSLARTKRRWIASHGAASARAWAGVLVYGP